MFKFEPEDGCTDRQTDRQTLMGFQRIVGLFKNYRFGLPNEVLIVAR
jgi:hypothetical protein